MSLLKRLAARTNERDERALAAAAAIFVFLLLVKVTLLVWNMTSTDRRPLGDLPADGLLYLPGADLLACFVLAGCFLLLQQIAGRAGWIGRILRVALWAFVIFFSVSSFQVARIFGAPLDIDLVRAGDDLMVLRRSIWEYIGYLPIVLLLIGWFIAPLLIGRFAKVLARRQWLLPRWQIWTTAGMVSIALAGLQFVRLAHIDTFGVKENALLHFVRHYTPSLRPIDLPGNIAVIEAEFKDSLQRTALPASIAVPGGIVKRDFAYTPSPAPRDLNLIFIQMESTSALHVDPQSAPNICALAQTALNFRRHLTAMTQTRSATYALNYSDYLPDLTTTPGLVYNRPMPQPALAEVLHSAGYQTGLFHTGLLDYLEIRYLFADKGMDTLVGAREMNAAGEPMAYSSAVREEATVDRMVAWIHQHKNQKFFADYITEFPHHPYLSFESSKPFPQDTWLNRYRNSLHYADSAVGRLVDALRAEGLIDKTLIVIVGDHGETVSTYPVGHGLHASVEEMRTPCVMSNPVLFPAAIQSEMTTSHVDLAPTIVHLLGLTPPHEWLGRNLLAEENLAVMEFVTFPHCRKIAVVDDGLVTVRDERSGALELFAMESDELAPIPADDPRHKLLPHYGREAEWFGGWSTWRHLKRAQMPQVVQQPPAVAASRPARDAEKASFSGQ